MEGNFKTINAEMIDPVTVKAKDDDLLHAKARVGSADPAFSTKQGSSIAVRQLRMEDDNFGLRSSGALKSSTLWKKENESDVLKKSKSIVSRTGTLSKFSTQKSLSFLNVNDAGRKRSIIKREILDKNAYKRAYSYKPKLKLEVKIAE